MSDILYFLSLVGGIASWYWVAKKMKLSGKGAVLRHLVGMFAGFVTLLIVATVAIQLDPKAKQEIAKQNAEAKAAQTTPPAAPQAPAPVQSAATEKPATVVKTFDMDFDTLRRRANEDFKKADLPYKISDQLEPTLSDGAVRKTVIVQLDDNLHAVIATDPTSNRITSITVNMVGSNDSMKNLQRGASAALLLAAADGDEGNQTVGGDIIQMMNKTMKTYTANPKKEENGKSSFTRNNVKYSIMLSNVLPIMLFAEPVEGFTHHPIQSHATERGFSFFNSH